MMKIHTKAARNAGAQIQRMRALRLSMIRELLSSGHDGPKNRNIRFSFVIHRTSRHVVAIATFSYALSQSSRPFSRSAWTSMYPVRCVSQSLKGAKGFAPVDGEPK